MSMDISAAAQPRSDQINADDLIGGPCIVTIAEVCRGNEEQPVNIITEEFGRDRPYKPGKSMLRVLITAWGKDASVYTGRRLVLYRDPDVRFGKDAVGGIRISAMSHINSRITLALTVTRGRRAPFVIDPLRDEPVKGMSEATRKKWTDRMIELLVEGDCAGVDDQVIVVNTLVEREISALDNLTDDELKIAANAINDWSKAGKLGASITDRLSAYVLTQSDEPVASVEGSDATDEPMEVE